MAFNFDAVLERKKARDKGKDKENESGSAKGKEASERSGDALPKALFDQFENAAAGSEADGQPTAQELQIEQETEIGKSAYTEDSDEVEGEDRSSDGEGVNSEQGEDDVKELGRKKARGLRDPGAERTDILYVTLNEDAITAWAPSGVLPPSEKPPRAVQFPLPIPGVVAAPTSKPPRDFSLKSRSIVEYPPIGVRAPVEDPPRREKSNGKSVMGALENMASAAVGGANGVCVRHDVPLILAGRILNLQ